MNRPRYYWLLLFLSLALLVQGCKPAGTEEKTGEKAPDAKTTESVKEVGIEIAPEVQARIGLELEPIRATNFVPETKCFGRAVDPSSLVASVREIALARATLVLSQKEFERVKVLHEQKNASERTLQAAEGAVERDRLGLQIAQEKLQLTWGTEIAKNKDIAELIQRLTDGEKVLVRFDLPVGEPVGAISKSLNCSFLPETDTFFEGQFIGTAPAIDPTMLGRGLFYLVSIGREKLPVGSAVMAKMPSGAPASGFVVPIAAMLLHDGERWFYRATPEGRFKREFLGDGVPIGAGYFVTNHVVTGDRVVVIGAQQLLSEELKSQIAPE